MERRAMSTQALLNDTDDILTKSELAEFLDVSERTVERWIEERTVPFVLLPQRGTRSNIRFLKSTIIQWLKRNEHKASNKYSRKENEHEEEQG
jgi:excisionase family DNA binding protein